VNKKIDAHVRKSETNW